MASNPYTICTHRDVPDLPDQLVALSNAAFAEYPGAMPADRPFMEWYLRRPGCRPGLCMAALHHGKLVANVLVAIQGLQLGGEVIPCGIIDTVATDPQHRRRGLARKLMERAHRAMQESGAQAAVLYTNPDGHPFRFYGSLGYSTRAFGAALLGPRPEPTAPPPRPARTEDVQPIRDLIDHYHRRHDGYAPITDSLWRWRREDRPEGMTLDLLMTRPDTRPPTATIAIAQVDVILDGDPARTSVICEFACREDGGTHLANLLASARTDRILAFVDVRAPLHTMLTDLGFKHAMREAAMLLPFTDRARAALETRLGPWYVMVESVVGV